MGLELEKSVQQDAPHTGARLETTVTPRMVIENGVMPPTRGHDLKLQEGVLLRYLRTMPPTRGHDLKPKSP